MEIGGAFAAFRAIRLLVLLNNVQFFETTTTSLRAIIGALAYNLKYATAPGPSWLSIVCRFIGNVLLLFLIFFAVFSQFAIENFHYSMMRRCVTVDGGLVVLPQRCPQHWCPWSSQCNQQVVLAI